MSHPLSYLSRSAVSRRRSALPGPDPLRLTYFVLRPGERLYTGVYTVYVTGYLLTNRSFLPDVERN